MKHFTNLLQLPKRLPSPFITIGNFDGVHLGHQEILRRVVAEARAAAGCSIVVTFDPHPLRILLPESAPPLILTPQQKLTALAEHGIDMTLVLRFDDALARWSPRQFIEKVLVDRVSARKVFVGSNFVFGYQQRGTVEVLQHLGAEFGFAVESIPQFTWRRTRVSSTLIRGFIREGHVAEANRLLGRYFALEGKVVSGAGRGRKLAVPTLNLAPENELIPKPGVYVTHTSFLGGNFPSVTNVGIRPTFNESDLSFESHLLNPMENEAPDRLSLAFLHRLRDEKKFSSTEELKDQIGRDVQAAKRYFARLIRFASPVSSRRQL
jgi:riboflavin kinase/FMN adenylyltransferase